jgi:3D (Asp-Asp-Asp) domain-containing protein
VRVRLTYYTDSGVARYGCPTLPGMAATDPEVIPPGTFFRIEGWPRLYYACDTGGLVQGWHVDVWVPDEDEGRAMLAQLGDQVTLQILQSPRS